MPLKEKNGNIAQRIIFSITSTPLKSLQVAAEYPQTSSGCFECGWVVRSTTVKSIEHIQSFFFSDRIII
jgi:hypothetical protein